MTNPTGSTNYQSPYDKDHYENLKKLLSPALSTGTSFQASKKRTKEQKNVYIQNNKLTKGSETIQKIFSNLGLKLCAGYARLQHLVATLIKEKKFEWVNNEKILNDLNKRLGEIQEFSSIKIEPHTEHPPQSDLNGRLSLAIEELSIINEIGATYFKGHSNLKFKLDDESVKFKDIKKLQENLTTIKSKLDDLQAKSATSTSLSEIPESPTSPHAIDPITSSEPTTSTSTFSSTQNSSSNTATTSPQNSSLTSSQLKSTILKYAPTTESVKDAVKTHRWHVIVGIAAYCLEAFRTGTFSNSPLGQAQLSTDLKMPSTPSTHPQNFTTLPFDLLSHYNRYRAPDSTEALTSSALQNNYPVMQPVNTQSSSSPLDLNQSPLAPLEFTYRNDSVLVNVNKFCSLEEQENAKQIIQEINESLHSPSGNDASGVNEDLQTVELSTQDFTKFLSNFEADYKYSNQWAEAQKVYEQEILANIQQNFTSLINKLNPQVTRASSPYQDPYQEASNLSPTAEKSLEEIARSQDTPSQGFANSNIEKPKSDLNQSELQEKQESKPSENLTSIVESILEDLSKLNESSDLLNETSPPEVQEKALKKALNSDAKGSNTQNNVEIPVALIPEYIETLNQCKEKVSQLYQHTSNFNSNPNPELFSDNDENVLSMVIEWLDNAITNAKSAEANSKILLIPKLGSFSIPKVTSSGVAITAAVVTLMTALIASVSKAKNREEDDQGISPELENSTARLEGNTTELTKKQRIALSNAKKDKANQDKKEDQFFRKINAGIYDILIRSSKEIDGVSSDRNIIYNQSIILTNLSRKLKDNFPDDQPTFNQHLSEYLKELKKGKVNAAGIDQHASHLNNFIDTILEKVPNIPKYGKLIEFCNKSKTIIDTLNTIRKN